MGQTVCGTVQHFGVLDQSGVVVKEGSIRGQVRVGTVQQFGVFDGQSVVGVK